MPNATKVLHRSSKQSMRHIHASKSMMCVCVCCVCIFECVCVLCCALLKLSEISICVGKRLNACFVGFDWCHRSVLLGFLQGTWAMLLSFQNTQCHWKTEGYSSQRRSRWKWTNLLSQKPQKLGRERYRVYHVPRVEKLLWRKKKTAETTKWDLPCMPSESTYPCLVLLIAGKTLGVLQKRSQHEGVSSQNQPEKCTLI